MQRKTYPLKLKIGVAGITSMQNPNHDLNYNSHPGGQIRNHGRKAGIRTDRMEFFRKYVKNAQMQKRILPYLEEINNSLNGNGAAASRMAREELADLLVRIDRGKQRAFLADLSAGDIATLAKLRYACNAHLHSYSIGHGRVHRDATISEIYHAINAGLSGRIPKSDWRANAIYRGYERMVLETSK